jgi:ESCRT-II complex subunit VPS25
MRFWHFGWFYCNTPHVRAFSPSHSGRLSIDVARIFLDHLVRKGYGEWIDKEKNNILLYWRTPEEWANIIYKAVDERGMLNTVVTFYELTESETFQNEGMFRLCFECSDSIEI